MSEKMKTLETDSLVADLAVPEATIIGLGAVFEEFLKDKDPNKGIKGIVTVLDETMGGK